MLSYVMLCYDMICYVMLCYKLPRTYQRYYLEISVYLLPPPIITCVYVQELFNLVGGGGVSILPHPRISLPPQGKKHYLHYC